MTIASRVAIIDSQSTAPKAIGARPATIADCVDITPWRLGAFAPRLALIEIDGSAAVTVSGPGASALGAELWGVVRGKLKLLTYLNAGQNIVVVDATHGWVEEVEDVGSATALYVAGDVAGGTATATFTPLEVWGAPK